MGNRITAPFLTALGADGRPLPGARLSVTVSGTGAPARLYRDPSLSTPWPEPILADGAGRFGDLYAATDAVLRLVLTDAAGVPVWTADPVRTPAGEVWQALNVLAFCAPGPGLRAAGGRLTIDWATLPETIVAAEDLLVVMDQSAGLEPRRGRASDLVGALGPVTWGAIGGLELALTGSVLTVGPGQARDGADRATLRLVASLAKRIDQGWAAGAGQGALGQGVAADAGETLELLLIGDPVQGVTDLLLLPPGSGPPNLPPGFSHHRRIGALLLGEGGVPRPFVRAGDWVCWTRPTLDAAVLVLTVGDLYRLAVPKGRPLLALVQVQLGQGGDWGGVLVSDPLAEDLAPSRTAAPLFSLLPGEPGGDPSGQVWVRTDAEGRVRVRGNMPDGALACSLSTLAYLDPRAP